MTETMSMSGEQAFPGGKWVSRWIEAINTDSECNRLGKWFDARVLFDFGGERYILRFVNGIVNDVIAQPIWDKPWDFGVKASKECWEKSRQDPPPPFHQDIFGMMWNHGMTLEGDVVAAMQNIRALKLVLGLMKRVK
jgi:hypothetical protein